MSDKEREDYERQITQLKEEVKLLRDEKNTLQKQILELRGDSTAEPSKIENSGSKNLPDMVSIPNKYYMIGMHPVTQELWESVMGNNPSQYKGKHRPVECLSWTDCIRFCNKLSERDGFTKAYRIKTYDGEDEDIEASDVVCDFQADGYRLPTDWEWWFAATGNQALAYSGSDDIDDVAWYQDNSDGHTHDVGTKNPNGFGIYDMNGNVHEWCWDWWDRYTWENYGQPPTEDSKGPEEGTAKLIRGGTFDSSAEYCRLDKQVWAYVDGMEDYVGIRLCRTVY